MKKLIKERLLYHYGADKLADSIMKTVPKDSIAYEIAYGNKQAAQAVIAELLIIQNKLSILNFLSR